MPLNDKLLYLTGTPTVPVAITVDAYSAIEVDFGVADPNVNAGGANIGLHIIVGETFATTVSIDFVVMHSASATATVELISRLFLVADLTIGKHYFIPFPAKNKQYVRAYYDVSTSASAGKVFVYIGPDTDGTE